MTNANADASAGTDVDTDTDADNNDNANANSSNGASKMLLSICHMTAATRHQSSTTQKSKQ